MSKYVMVRDIYDALQRPACDVGISGKVRQMLKNPGGPCKYKTYQFPNATKQSTTKEFGRCPQGQTLRAILKRLKQHRGCGMSQGAKFSWTKARKNTAVLVAQPNRGDWSKRKQGKRRVKILDSRERLLERLRGAVAAAYPLRYGENALRRERILTGGTREQLLARIARAEAGALTNANFWGLPRNNAPGNAPGNALGNNNGGGGGGGNNAPGNNNAQRRYVQKRTRHPGRQERRRLGIANANPRRSSRLQAPQGPRRSTRLAQK